MLASLVAHNAAEYERWTAQYLRAALRVCGVTVRKSDGAMVVRADDAADALTVATGSTTGRRQGVSLTTP